MTDQNQQPAYLREVSIKLKKRRIKDGSLVNQPITDAQQVFELFADLQDEAKEKLLVIALDIKLKIICYEVVAMGSTQAVFAKPAEAIRIPIAMGAAGMIFLHNHPSGDPEPSEQDKTFTSRIESYCKDLGLIIYDHVIIGDGRYFSFTEEGLLHASGNE